MFSIDLLQESRDGLGHFEELRVVQVKPLPHDDGPEGVGHGDVQGSLLNGTESYQ